MAHPNRPWWIRLVLCLGAGLASAVVAAIVLAVVDLYLTGHGLEPLNAPLRLRDLRCAQDDTELQNLALPAGRRLARD